MSSYNSFQNKVTYSLFTYKSYIYIYIYTYKVDLALNNLQGLIYHKTSTKQTKSMSWNKEGFIF